MPAKRPAKSKPPTKPAARATKPTSRPATKVTAVKSPARRPAPSTTVSAVPDAGAARSTRATPATASSADAGRRAQRWAQVTARDLMRTDLVTVPYSAPLSEVERLLSDNRIHGAPVVDHTGKIMGVVSVKDLMDRYAESPGAKPRRGQGYFVLSTEELAEEDLESFEVPEESEEIARDIMTAQIFSVPATAGLREIADTMCDHKIHRVLVADGGRLVGLISTLDVLEALRA